MIDAIATANYERFSSSIREFAVYSSTVYPTSSWTFLGYFEALDSSELQVFNVTASVWSKFVKVEWLSWYRNEAICTMSEFRVYGLNMMNAMLVFLKKDQMMDRKPSSMFRSIKCRDVGSEDRFHV